MIKEFNNLPVRESGIIYDHTLNQIKEFYNVDPNLAGELAISAIELVLTGETSTDNEVIKIMLKPLEKKRDVDELNWTKKTVSKQEKQIVDQKLDQIANLINKGYKQREIAERLGLTQQTVSYRMKVIKDKYSGLLIKEEDDVGPSPTASQTKNENTNNFTKIQNNTNENVCKTNKKPKFNF